MLDKIRSIYNVGSIFRTCDGFGVKKIWLCGYTPGPEHEKLHKTALGAEESVTWERAATTWRLIDRLKKEGFFVVAIEITPDAVPMDKLKLPKGTKKVALVLGHEIEGVSDSVLRRVHAKAVIPMAGIKESFNVTVAGGIALYEIAKRR